MEDLKTTSGSNLKRIIYDGVVEEFYKTHTQHFCTVCSGKMRYTTAVTQIENKRPNAPICIKCCLK